MLLCSRGQTLGAESTPTPGVSASFIRGFLGALAPIKVKISGFVNLFCSLQITALSLIAFHFDVILREDRGAELPLDFWVNEHSSGGP